MRSLRPCSDSSATPSFPSQPEGKIGLPRANPSLTLAYAVSASNTLDQLGLDPGSSLEISYTRVGNRVVAGVTTETAGALSNSRRCPTLDTFSSGAHQAPPSLGFSRQEFWSGLPFPSKAEAPTVWPPDAKNGLTGKDPDAGRDWGQEEKGTTEDEMAGWNHRLDGHEFE